MKRSLVWSTLVMALIGLGCIGFGVHMVNRDWVECEIGHRMQPGELCLSRAGPRYGHTTIDTYEERAETQKRVGYAAIGGGALLLGALGWSVWKEVRRSRSEQG